jgi:hypothetical protein
MTAAPSKTKGGDGKFWHIMPYKDLKEHDETLFCWCNPCVEVVVVLHNSLDGRESYENGRKLN